MSDISMFGKRKLYLINHDPIGSAARLEAMGTGLSKFVVLQTINEFKDGIYNDSISGELYNNEAIVKSKLKPDEYYLILSVSANAISHTTFDGQVFIHKGFIPKIFALKTNTETYLYQEGRGFYKDTTRLTMSESNRHIYNYLPGKWPIFSMARGNIHFQTRSYFHEESMN